VGGLKLVKQPVMSSLILKRASASRPSGQWNDDDFDVLADGAVGGSCPWGSYCLKSGDDRR